MLYPRCLVIFSIFLLALNLCPPLHANPKLGFQGGEPTAYQKTFFVDGAAATSGDGSEPTPFATISEAIRAADGFHPETRMALPFSERDCKSGL